MPQDSLKTRNPVWPAVSISGLVLLLLVSFTLTRELVGSEAATCIDVSVEVLFAWEHGAEDVRISNLTIEDIRRGKLLGNTREPDPPLRGILENQAHKAAIQFVQKTGLSHGKGRLVGHAMGCEPYLVMFQEREAIEPDVRLFMVSVWEGDRETVKRMLSSGFEVNTRQWLAGTTALLYAESAGDPEMTQVLLDAGADPDLTNDEGVTPLMLASQRGKLGIVRTLLDAGADVNLRSAKCDTALSLAKKFGHTQVADMLRKYGARE